jgi:hypothetical protein
MSATVLADACIEPLCSAEIVIGIAAIQRRRIAIAGFHALAM